MAVKAANHTSLAPRHVPFVCVASLDDICTRILGYVSAERAPLIGKRMQTDEAISVFQGMIDQGAYIRIRFGGDPPTLPPAPLQSSAPRPAQPPRPMRIGPRPVIDVDAFYPDPEGPEWCA